MTRGIYQIKTTEVKTTNGKVTVVCETILLFPNIFPDILFQLSWQPNRGKWRWTNWRENGEILVTTSSLSLLSTILAPSTPKVSLSLSLSVWLLRKTKLEKWNFKFWIWISYFSLTKLKIAEQEEMIRSFEKTHAQQSRLWRVGYIWLVPQSPKWAPLYL